MDAAKQNISTHRIKFTGKAGEFFGIWFVNNLLTSITLGIYSPWAKVRNLQYLYGNTELDGASFQFTANPMKILGSRMIASLLFILYFVASETKGTLALIVLITLVSAYFIFAPILTVWVISFRLRYSQWRGINFGFEKNYKEAYRVYLIPLIALFIVGLSFYLPMKPTIEQWETEIAAQEEQYEQQDTYNEDHESEYNNDYSEPASEDAVVTDSSDAEPFNLWLLSPFFVCLALFIFLIPYFDFLNTRFFVSHARFGTAKTHFSASIADFYHVYAYWIILTLLLIAGWLFALGADDYFGTITLLSFLYIPISQAIIKARRYNITLSKTVIDGNHRLLAKVPTLKLLWIIITNHLGILFSFGLATAWAKVRTQRLLLSYSVVQSKIGFDNFIAAQEESTSALAEEIGDVFDLDLPI